MLAGWLLSNTLLQANTDDSHRGRVMSVYMMNWGLTMVGVFFISMLADTIGVQLAVGGAAGHSGRYWCYTIYFFHVKFGISTNPHFTCRTLRRGYWGEFLYMHVKMIRTNGAFARAPPPTMSVVVYSVKNEDLTPYFGPLKKNFTRI